MGLKAGDATTTLQERVHRSERFADDFRNPHEAAPNALLGELEDLRLSVVQDLFRRITLLRRPGDSSGGGVNEAAQQGLVADNPDVMLDTRPIGNTVEQPGDVGRAADGFEFAVPAEL